MNTAFKTLFAGMLALVFSATAIAHDNVDGSWSGGVTVSVLPGGQVALGGGVSYGPVVYQPVTHAVVPVPHHYPACRHPSHPRHKARGRGHGHKHRDTHSRRW